MDIYLYGRRTSSAPRQHHQKSNRRRYSAHAWDHLRDQINREHRVIAASDPRSPRIKQTLAQWGVR